MPKSSFLNQELDAKPVVLRNNWMTLSPVDFQQPGPRDPLRSYVWVSAAGGAVFLAGCGALWVPSWTPSGASLWAPPGAPGAPLAWAAGGVLYAVGSGLAAQNLWRSYPHATLGACNAVTQMRLVLLSLVAVGLLATSAPGWVVFALALATFALDGVDGWLARRAALVSGFGARFDMEVDSAFALVLATGAVLHGTFGPVVLVLGLSRYAFLAACRVWPWLAPPLPERWSRKAVCVAQIATLVALQAPDFPAPLAAGAVGAVTLLLAWSFASDVLVQWRRATHPDCPE